MSRGDAAEDGEGEQAGGWAGVDGERAEREGAEPPTAGGTREVTEGAPAGKQREHDAAENGLVVNVGAAAEKKYGASETDMGCEQDRLPRGGARTLGAEQAARVEEQEVRADERGGVIQEHGGAAEFAKGQAENDEREPEQRRGRAEVAVDFSCVNEGFLL